MASKKDNVSVVSSDWSLYEQGVQLNHSLRPDYYATVNRNWRVFNVQHWEGVNTGGLPVVSLPMFQRIIRHMVASVMTNRVKMNYVIENIGDDTQDAGEMERKALAEVLSKNSVDKWEKQRMDSAIRSVLYDGAMSGDMALHTYWDETIKTGSTNGEEYVTDVDGEYTLDEAGTPQTRPVPILGDFMTEAVDGCNVFLGNPNDPRINFNGRAHQPYVIVSGRSIVSKLRKEAKQYKKENGLSADEVDNKIAPDEEYNEQAGDRGRKELENRDSDNGKATYIIKYWADDDGKIRMNKSVKDCFIRKNVDTELTIYPVAWANWDLIKNSYHGQAVATGLVHNQLELDKAYAKLFKYIGDVAFPKTAYNTNVLPNGISNKINETIPVDVDEHTSLSNVIYQIQPGQFANKIIDVIQMFMQQTMNLLGVSDSVLGIVNPENTSAIIANTQNSFVPLENVKANLYQLIEDLGYIWLEFTLKKYKVPRKIAIESEIDGKQVRQMVMFDPTKVKDAQFRIKIDVGPSSYYSEQTLIKTLENLFDRQVIDAIQFIKRLPEDSIPEKDKLVAELDARVKQQEALAQLAQMTTGGAGGQLAQMPQPQ